MTEKIKDTHSLRVGRLFIRFKQSEHSVDKYVNVSILSNINSPVVLRWTHWAHQ